MGDGWETRRSRGKNFDWLIIKLGRTGKINNKIQNLTSIVNGAVPIACNNEHFGRAENILAPGVGRNMGDG